MVKKVILFALSVSPSQVKIKYLMQILTFNSDSYLGFKHSTYLSAGHFSHPTLLRENGVDGGKSRLFCNSRGGFPAPSIYWLVNHTQRPPETLVTTFINTLPQSKLYNITSILSINISADTAVTCVIENDLLNETLTATSCKYLVSFPNGGGLFCIHQIICKTSGCLVTWTIQYSAWDVQ